MTERRRRHDADLEHEPAAAPGAELARPDRSPPDRTYDGTDWSFQGMDAGRALPEDVRQGVERETGGDLSQARLHDGPEANAAVDAAGSRAFTYGKDVFLGSGERATDRALVAHEATHVVQQASAAAPSVMHKKGETNARLPTKAEKDADEVAEYVERSIDHDKDPVDKDAPPEPEHFPQSGSVAVRQHAAAARLELIERSIGTEDGQPAGRTTKGKKDEVTGSGHETVAHQIKPGIVKAAHDAAKALEDAIAAKKQQTELEPLVAAFEHAVRAYQDAYEKTYLVSTDDKAPAAYTWKVDLDKEPNLDSLNREGAAASIKKWVAAGHETIKFAIPAARPGEVHVGVDHSHLEIAGGNAMTAGFLKFDKTAKHVSEVENVSGGYRPGPLRNAIVLERLEALGFIQANLDGVEVHNHPDGSYDGSHLG